MYLNSDRNTHCSAPLLAASIKLNMAVWSIQILHIFHLQLINYLNTSMGSLLPMQEKQHICSYTVSGVKSFKTNMKALLLLWHFNKICFFLTASKLSLGSGSQSGIPLGLGLPFLNVWQGTCSFCVNHWCSVPDCFSASPVNSRGCTGVIRCHF